MTEPSDNFVDWQQEMEADAVIRHQSATNRPFETTATADVEAVAEDAELAALPVRDERSIAVYDQSANPNSMPVYEGPIHDMHEAVTPGLYRAQLDRDWNHPEVFVTVGDGWSAEAGPADLRDNRPINDPVAEPDADSNYAGQDHDVDVSRQR